MKVEKLKYGIVIALLVFLSIHYLSYPLLGPDSGFYLANARDLYAGKVYFIDIAIAYNPLAIAVLGLPFLFSDSPDPRWSLLINMLFIWASAYILYRILRQIDRAGKENAFYALFFVAGCLLLDGSHLVLEPVSVFFQLAGLLCYLNHKASRKYSLLVFAGLAFALSFLAKQYGLFVLAPVGIDILLSRKSILKKIVLMAFGFLVPIGIFYAYLAGHGASIGEFIKDILGIGLQLEMGTGTGINYSLVTYLIGFGIFLMYNLYVLFIPYLLIKSGKPLKIKEALPLAILPFSLLVLVSASYAHYFLYVLPYALMAFVYLKHVSGFKSGLMQAPFLASLLLMLCVSVISFGRKQEKIDFQEEAIRKLSSEIPEGSKVYLDGVSPAFYYLCGFGSVRLDRFGYTFPGYFYPKTIVSAMDKNAYLVVSAGAFPSYRKLVETFQTKQITIGGQTFLIIKKP